MHAKKLSVFMVSALVLAWSLSALAAAQAPEKTADAAPTAAQERTETEKPEKPQTAEPEAERTAEPRSDRPAEKPAPVVTPNVEAVEADEGENNEDEADEAEAAYAPDGSAVPSALAIYIDGQELTDGEALIDWPDLSADAPTAVLKAVGADGLEVSPVYDSSDDAVVYVDEAGVVTAVGYGVATITATLDAQQASVRVAVGSAVRRVVIIGEDSVAHGRSIKLRAFDQDGNRIRAVWRSSSEKFATVDADGVVTASRGASGQWVEITAFADDALAVYDVKRIAID